MKHCEPEPASAVTLFGDRIESARAFTAALAEHGPERGLIGPSEVPRVWTRHVLNCAVLAPELRPGLVADIGSGAGLPGIVLAIARPDVGFVLIEPMERRVSWLREQADALSLSNVRIERARAEDLRSTVQADQVTARAVSALRTLVPIAAGLAKPGAELLLFKGAGAERELEAAAKAIRKYRLHNVEIVLLGAGLVAEETRVVRARVG